MSALSWLYFAAEWRRLHIISNSDIIGQDFAKHVQFAKHVIVKGGFAKTCEGTFDLYVIIFFFWLPNYMQSLNKIILYSHKYRKMGLL